jgi:hypothetical protein
MVRTLTEAHGSVKFFYRREMRIAIRVNDYGQ